MKRPVGLLLLLKLILEKKPYALIGLIFTLMSVFVLLPITLTISEAFAEAYEKYDYKEITTKGSEKQAAILSVTSMTNVSVNGSNPVRIAFEYENEDGDVVIDEFQTFDLDRAMRLKYGDSISIKEYRNQAVIQNMEPFHFPFEIFFILPVIFFVIGSIFLIIALIPALKTFRLYKEGTVTQGVITSIIANAGLPISGRGRKVFVDYYYTINGNKVFGTGNTTDFSILAEKKAGDTIRVFVSPDNEGMSCLVPEKEAMKQGWTL